MRRCLPFGFLVLAVAAFVAPAPAQMTQTLPPGFEAAPGGSVSSWPFNTASDQKWQWVIDTSLFAVQGPMVIQEISLRLASSTATSSGGTFSNVDVTLSSSPNNYIQNAAPPGGQDPIFANNLGADTSLVRSGPWVSGPVAAGAWIPLGITPGFTYDPTAGADLLIQIEKCGTVTSFGSTFDMVSSPPGTLGANRYGHTSSCTAATRNNAANEAVLIVKLDFAPLAITWQANQAGATVSLDGGVSNGLGPITATRPAGQSAPLVATSSVAGQPYDVGVSLLPGVPLGGGALTTTGGQILNLDFSDPNLILLFGLQFSNAFAPISTSLSLPAPGILSLQLVVLDPGQIDGFSLSALNSLISQ